MERLFSLIWRVNALVILAAGLAGLALVLVIFFQLVREYREPRRVEGVVNLANEEVESEVIEFGQFEVIPGSSYLTAALFTDQGYELGSVSKSSRSSRNYLFFDPVTRAAHWLLPDNDGLVEWRHQFPDPRRSSDPKPVKGVLWQVIDSDTNGDRKLTDSDLSSIYVSGASGRPLRRLLDGVQQVLGANPIASNDVSLMFLKDNTLRAATISLEQFAVVSDEAVSPRPSPSP